MRETRKANDGYTLRRVRSCPSGHRFSTYEVTAPIYRKEPALIKRVIEAAKARVVRWTRDAELAVLAKRMSHQAIANRLGMKKSTVGKAVRRAQT